MKQETKQVDVQAIRERREAARRMVSDLCNGHREWIMRVPAEKYDPDIVITDSLRDVSDLLSALSDAEGIVREMADHLKTANEMYGVHSGECFSCDRYAEKGSPVHHVVGCPIPAISALLNRPEVQSILSRGGK